MYFRNYWLRKAWLNKCLKIRVPEHRCTTKVLKFKQRVLKFVRQHFYHIFPSIWRKWSRKIFLLVISEILGLFVNKSTADDKYYFRNSENLRQSIQMQLSKK